MGTQAAMYQRNLESSILFMQQEHAATIKGLHEEISQLQKRCTDLTFQLTMQGLTTDESGTSDSKMQEMHRDLEASKNKISCLEKELMDKDKCVDRLETEARSQKKRWLDESRGQLQIMNTLRAELEAKANNIAYLTTELHRLKQKNKISQTCTEVASTHHGRVHSHSNVSGQAGHIHPNAVNLAQKSQTHHQYTPAPPRDKMVASTSASSRVRRPGHTKPATDIGHSGKPVIAIHPASALVSRQLNSHRLSGSISSGSESPDITPFLPQTKDNIIPVIGIKQPQVLPPIPVNSSSSVNTGSSSQPVLVHQVASSTSQHRQNKSSPSKTEAAIVTLAVENAATSDAWSFAHESRSSNYK